MNEKAYMEVAELLSIGIAQNRIAEKVGISISTVNCYSRMLKENPITKGELEKYRWLRKHWNFTGRTCGNDAYIGTHKNGYRVVRKGDKGHLRTPYRTDYKFR